MNDKTHLASAQGSDAPEPTRRRVGLLPRADWASRVTASELGLDREHDIEPMLSRWLDPGAENRRLAAASIAGKAGVDRLPDALTDRMFGQCDIGMGRRWQDSHRLAFHADGVVRDGRHPAANADRFSLQMPPMATLQAA